MDRIQLYVCPLQVRNGWREKNTQLNAINDILHDEKYKNVTGLAKVLNQYIQEQFSIAHEEDGKISAEERDVVDEKQVNYNRIKQEQLHESSANRLRM